jgi:hypothetical protein
MYTVGVIVKPWLAVDWRKKISERRKGKDRDGKK